jgi:hypothetical protein
MRVYNSYKMSLLLHVVGDPADGGVGGALGGVHHLPVAVQLQVGLKQIPETARAIE